MAHTTAGTIGGTLLALIAIPMSTIYTTIFLAILGATVSYGTSLFLKWLRAEYLIWKNERNSRKI